MTYQEFDEKLQRLNDFSPQRERKLRDRWTAISRRGALFYIATRGLLMCVWMLSLLWFFSSRLHATKLPTHPLLFGYMLPEVVLAGFMLPAMAYVTLRGAVISFDKRDRRLRRRRKLLA